MKTWQTHRRIPRDGLRAGWLHPGLLYVVWNTRFSASPSFECSIIEAAAWPGLLHCKAKGQERRILHLVYTDPASASSPKGTNDTWKQTRSSQKRQTCKLINTPERNPSALQHPDAIKMENLETSEWQISWLNRLSLITRLTQNNWHGDTPVPLTQRSRANTSSPAYDT